MKSERFLLDTSAILAYLWAENGGKAVKSFLGRAAKAEIELAMCELSVGEMYAVVGRKRGEKAADEALLIVRNLPLRLLPCGLDTILEAGRVKMSHRIALADCVVVAAARLGGYTVLTADSDIQALRNQVNVVSVR